MGGMEKVLVTYANIFVKNGYDVTVLNLTGDDPDVISGFNENVRYKRYYSPVKNISHAGIKNILRGNFRLLPWKNWIKLHSPGYLYKRYIKENYDFEIAFFGLETIKIISGSTNSHSHKVGWIHSSGVGQFIPAGYQKPYAQKVFRNIENVFCVSEESRKKLYELFGKRKNVFVVNNPCDEDAIRNAAKEEISQPKRAFTFICVSRLENKSKGYLRLFDVCEKLNREGLEYEIWIVGDGKDKETIIARAGLLHLDNIRFLGQQSNPYKFMSKSDMYLCASHYEGFSVSMSEAVILGLPVLSTNVSGTRELFEDGKYGFIVDNSEDGIYKGIKDILTQPDLYSNYKDMAAKRMNYFSKNNKVKEIERIIYGEKDSAGT
jgi:glycosyltransferase involved in cell wall biosynthesis